MAIWLIAQTVLVVGLVLMLHNLARRVGSVFRFLFYIPGALAGAASVIVWLFMLDPTASPFAFILHWFGYSDFMQVIAPRNLALIFAVMAFWTGAGGWIVVMYGALNNIPQELLEAADMDGAGAFQTAFRIKLPLIRKWVVYMLILSFAAGTQLFVEPTVLGAASLGIGIAKYWSPNQLAWFVASQYDKFNEAAAISVVLLALGLLVAALLVWRGRLFEVE
jgi:multiple sugar transport system permease protein